MRTIHLYFLKASSVQGTNGIIFCSLYHFDFSATGNNQFEAVPINNNSLSPPVSLRSIKRQTLHSFNNNKINKAKKTNHEE
jgi:competence transcription factor ComK